MNREIKEKLEDLEDILQKNLEISRENQQLLKIFALNEPLRDILSRELNKDWEKVLYESLDGESTTRELASKVPVSRMTLINRFKKWENIGLVWKNSNGRYENIVSLKALGIEIPDLEEQNE